MLKKLLSLKKFSPDGWKTHIVNIIRAGAVIALLFGVKINPEKAATLIIQFVDWAIAGEAIIAASLAYFRHLGNQRERDLSNKKDKLIQELSGKRHEEIDR